MNGLGLAAPLALALGWLRLPVIHAELVRSGVLGIVLVWIGLVIYPTIIVIFLYLGFAAVHSLRDIAAALRERNRAG